MQLHGNNKGHQGEKTVILAFAVRVNKQTRLKIMSGKEITQKIHPAAAQTGH